MFEIAFFILVVCAGVFIISLKITAPNAFFEFMLRAFAKLSSVYIIAYAINQLFKIFNL